MIFFKSKKKLWDCFTLKYLYFWEQFKSVEAESERHHTDCRNWNALYLLIGISINFFSSATMTLFRFPPTKMHLLIPAQRFALFNLTSEVSVNIF